MTGMDVLWSLIGVTIQRREALANFELTFLDELGLSARNYLCAVQTDGDCSVQRLRKEERARHRLCGAVQFLTGRLLDAKAEWPRDALIDGFSPSPIIVASRNELEMRGTFIWYDHTDQWWRELGFAFVGLVPGSDRVARYRICIGDAAKGPGRWRYGHRAFPWNAPKRWLFEFGGPQGTLDPPDARGDA